MVGEIIACLIFLLLSATFSATETAVFAIDKTKLKAWRNKSDARKLVATVLDDPTSFLVTIIIGNTVVNVMFSSLFTVLILKLARLYSIPDATALSISFVLSTFLLLVTGEITPKSLALSKPEFWARKLIYIMKAFEFIFKKVLFIHQLILIVTQRISLALGASFEEDKHIMSEEEIEEALDSIYSESGFSEAKLIKNLILLREITVKEIMIPRTEVVSISEEATIKEAIEKMKETKHSKLPVYKGKTLDNISGILYAKDIYILTGKQLEEKVKSFTRTPLFVHETRTVEGLLEDFKKHKVQIAIVVDEYGGIEGLVSIEDVFREILGEISDEYYQTKTLITQEGDTIICDAKVQIEDVENFIKRKIAPDDREYETLAGFIMSLAGRIPQEGEEFKVDDVIIKVEEANGKTIKKVSIKFVE